MNVVNIKKSGSGEIIVRTTHLPSCTTNPPRGAGRKGDDDGIGNTLLSQPGGAKGTGSLAPKSVTKNIK